MNNQEFMREFTEICEYYDRKPNAIQAKVWYKIFSKFSVELFQDAIMRHFKESESPHFPAPGRILNLLTENKGTKGAGSQLPPPSECASPEEIKAFVAEISEKLKLPEPQQKGGLDTVSTLSPEKADQNSRLNLTQRCLSRPI